VHQVAVHKFAVRVRALFPETTDPKRIGLADRVRQFFSGDGHSPASTAAFPQNWFIIV
jgi:hypothetical protein